MGLCTHENEAKYVYSGSVASLAFCNRHLPHGVKHEGCEHTELAESRLQWFA
jgi:hypothetical protein